MPSISEIYRHLNAVLPTSLSCDWDNDGLMVCTSPDKEVKKILLALDVTPAIAEYAVKIGAELIISHHPLIFSGIKRMDGHDGTSRKVISLIQNDIAVMSFHTRLDAADGGVNDILASLFSLSNVEKFGVDGDTAARIGTLPKPMAFEDFCRLVKDTLGAPSVCGAKGGETVSRLAVLGFVSSEAQFVRALAVFKEIHEILYGGLSDVFKGFFGQEGLMGSDDDVGHGDQARQNIVV